MPKGQRLPAFIRSLTPGRLAAITTSASQGPDAQLYFPKFTTRNYLNLNAALASMGMPIAFSRRADFSAMSPVPLQIQSAVQRDYLSVAEKGTQAAAATGVSMIAQSLTVVPQAQFDHPFLFVIRDVTTGAVLFASAITNPAG